MQSTGHSSMQALSLRSTQGCAITYVTTVLLMSGRAQYSRPPPISPSRGGRDATTSRATRSASSGTLMLMGRIVMPVSVTLDGFHEGPGADLGWQTVDE